MEKIPDANRRRRNNLSPVPLNVKSAGLIEEDTRAGNEDLERALLLSKQEELERQQKLFSQFQFPARQPGTPPVASAPSFLERVRKRAYQTRKSGATDSAKKRGTAIFRDLANADPVYTAVLEDGEFPNSQSAYEELEGFIIDG